MAAFGPDDIARTGLTVEPVADTAGLLSREEALAVALENFNPPDPDVQVDPYLFKATSPGSLGSDQPIRDLAVWIVRYSNLTIHSPSGVELHWAYSIFDAATGTYLGGNWAR